MTSFELLQRQLRLALILLAIIFPVGIIGYMIFEDLSFIDAFWITVITLATIGYGDVVPTTNAGRIFTVMLLVVGLGSVALAAQVAVEFFVSPSIRQIRYRRRTERRVQSLKDHYILVGEGELVDRTITYLLRRAELRRYNQREAMDTLAERRVGRIFGRVRKIVPEDLRQLAKRAVFAMLQWGHTGDSFLDIIVVITSDSEYASRLQESNLNVLEDDPSDDRALRRAGITHARALMVMLENDHETLLTVLTARSRSSNVYITATTQGDFARKMTQVGANNVLNPYDIAGQFLNNATLRPAVNTYFSSILFDQKASDQIVQVYLAEGSKWIGRHLRDLRLRERFETGIIGLQTDDGHFIPAPGEDITLLEDMILLAVTPGRLIPMLLADARSTIESAPKLPSWQRLPAPHRIQTSDRIYSLIEAEEAVDTISQHYIIAGTGPIVRQALDDLSPERPFVVVSNDNVLVSDMLKRGFRVIHGSPAEDETLRRAGIDKALAIMVSLEDRADSVLTILNSRTLNRSVLIVATASSDDMIPKLRRAGADRVVTPFRIAAQFILLATTRPAVSDFVQHVLYNYQGSIETTELYMQENSPWIGKTLGELQLEETYHAGVIGIQQTNGSYIYAPDESYRIAIDEILIAIVPMETSDEMRLVAHGGTSHRPKTLRRTYT